jgi:N-acetylglucosaminyldiphosphoundecaprenol N-acetyl-beta-D-mannosaminyltransferase
MPGWPHDSVDVMGVRVSVADVPLLRRLLGEAVRTRRQLLVTFANPNYVMAAQRDSDLRELMNAFDLNLADGWGVVLAARILGRRLPTRMANDDLTDDVFGLAAQEGWRVYLLGNAPGVAATAGENLARWYPGVVVAGTQHGHWGVADGRVPAAHAERLIAEINEVKPDILQVGLGTPLQQTFVIENRDRLEVPVIITCGAYLEHLAERREWYPIWVLRLRIGFLYRLYRDPKRLWYRYTVELASYLLRLCRHRLRAPRSQA